MSSSHARLLQDDWLNRSLLINGVQSNNFNTNTANSALNTRRYSLLKYLDILQMTITNEVRGILSQAPASRTPEQIQTVGELLQKANYTRHLRMMSDV